MPAPGEGCLVPGGCLLPGGAWSEGSLLQGVPGLRGLCSGGGLPGPRGDGIPACTEADPHLHEQNDRQV